MRFALIAPLLLVLVLELFAFVKVVRKFRSPYASAVAIAGLFIVNILLYVGVINLWISQTPT